VIEKTGKLSLAARERAFATPTWILSFLTATTEEAFASGLTVSSLPQLVSSAGTSSVVQISLRKAWMPSSWALRGKPCPPEAESAVDLTPYPLMVLSHKQIGFEESFLTFASAASIV
jgi:hypothetical protein